MSPIRVGLIGLSGAPPDKYQGTAWAASAHLPYLLDSDAYTLVALCNTSVESAKKAVKMYGLPESVKTYGNPEGMFLSQLDLYQTQLNKYWPYTDATLYSSRARCRSGR